MIRNETNSDLLERLIKYAGRRKAVDPERTERVEQHVTEHWQQLMKKRRASSRRTKITIFSGGLAVAASILIAINFLPKLAGPSPVAGSTLTIAGTVDIGARGEQMTSLVAGDKIRSGSLLETGKGSGAALQLETGHSLRIAADSRLRIESQSIQLDRGRIYLDSGADGQSVPLIINSSVATVREMGTQYQLLLIDDGLEVSVREGKVKLERDEDVFTARAGEAIQLNTNGQTNRETITTHGDRWQWVAQLGPALDLEGQTLADFLEWLSRENGWQVKFANNSQQRDASNIRLTGSTEGLAPEEALASVMATVGWSYTLDNGVVMIDQGKTASSL